MKYNVGDKMRAKYSFTFKKFGNDYYCQGDNFIIIEKSYIVGSITGHIEPIYKAKYIHKNGTLNSFIDVIPAKRLEKYCELIVDTSSQ